MKKEKLDDYELFYLEIPQSDYLNDLDFGTDEDLEESKLNESPNLSAEQVSAIARDQLGASDKDQPANTRAQSDTSPDHT